MNTETKDIYADTEDMAGREDPFTVGGRNYSTDILYKKGDKLACHNYRPMTLLYVSYKIFAILLNNRLVATIESKLDNCQMGFRPNRSTIDNIFIVRQIYEKCCQFNIDITYL
jgi:hypothetical protein